jgi:dienelactone hydrolase
MPSCLWCVIALFLGTAGFPLVAAHAAAPRDLNTPWTFPQVRSQSDWKMRAAAIRQQVQLRCGLWPWPEKTPLAASISGRIDRDGYSVEKVYFQTYPGFYLAGNLYRPRNGGNGPFPAVLNPHGHWSNGRMADTTNGSIAARCIHFARNNVVAFSYDMVGYNDTVQVDHQFARDPTNQLWNISLMGLQTWNSIRALDFLESLPEVDRTRMACTGESGGGTQTFMLGALDDRLAAQAPIVMVSHSMQGGCLCENAPGLRIHYSNMELAAVPAPRPQLLVAASGDWTKTTMTVEGPALAGVYQLFGAADRFRHVLFDFEHNYNQTSREAVYEWFGRWLKPIETREKSYQKESDRDLRVWPDGQLPPDALDEPRLIASLVTQYRAQLAKLRPVDRASLDRYRQTLRPLWQQTLEIEHSDASLKIQAGPVNSAGPFRTTHVRLQSGGNADAVQALLCSPARENLKFLVILAHPRGKRAYLDGAGMPVGLARQILDRQQSVLLLDWTTGDGSAEAQTTASNLFAHYFTTYNRTPAQERVQDLLTASAFAKLHSKGRRVVLVGQGRAGLWTLLAAPGADAVAADADQVDLNSDQALLAPDLFVPGIRKIGGWEAVMSFSAPNPLLVHNLASDFPQAPLADLYQAVGGRPALQLDPTRKSDGEIVEWIARVTKL